MHHNAIPEGEALVLFDYMTRSFQDIRERKLSRYRPRFVPATPPPTPYTLAGVPHASPLAFSASYHPLFLSYSQVQLGCQE